MTAFARRSCQDDWGVLTWEVRAVNHRFLEISIRLPEGLRELEPSVREILTAHCQRGKIEAQLKLNTGEQSPVRLVLNTAMVKQLAGIAEKIHHYFPQTQNDLMAILNWPGVLNAEANYLGEIGQIALDLLRKVGVDLVQMRQREGEQIKLYIEQRLSAILAIIKEVEQRIPELLAAERERMRSWIKDFETELDGRRLEHEMAILMQKSDVAEEIQRLISHCHAMLEALTQPGAIGRRLDFLSQELHREANTLSNKALDVTVTRASIEMKVLIEQIREQVQNVE